MKRRPQTNRSKPFSRSGSSRGSSSAPGRGGGASPQREIEIPKSWRVIVGHHAINEALKVRPQQVKLLWLKQGWESSQDLRELSEKATRLKLKMDIKSGPVIEKLCATHQGAVLFVDGAPTLDLSRLDTFQKSTLVLLDGIEDPHNLGAILRTSWLVGAHGLIIPEDRAVGLTPTAHKVACGGAEHVPVVELTSFANYIEELKKKGYWVFGLSHKATQTIYQFDIPDKVVWAVGAEDRGLRVTTERLCDGLVSIPQLSAAASYNASVAAGMTLGETLRRHSHHGVPKK